MFNTTQTVSKAEKVMTTRTFCKKSGRQHGNVMTMLRKMVEKGELDLKESYYTNGNGSTQYSEFQLTLNDFEKIAHRLKEKEIKGVRKYFGVPPAAVEEAQADPPQQLTLLATAIIPQDDVLTMSSLEIADLTGKRHGDVLRDIRLLIDAIGDVAELQHVKSVLDSRGYTAEMRLPRAITETLITGYSVPLRLAVIRRLHELEAEVAKPQALTLPDFTNPAMAARAWASEFEGRLLALEAVKVQEQKIAEDKPKVEFYEDVAVAEGCQTMKQVADELGVGRNSLYSYLRKHKVLIERGKDHNSPYQVHKEAGRFDVVLEPYKHPHTGKLTFGPLTMVTGKGLIFIRELIEKHGRSGLGPD